MLWPDWMCRSVGVVDEDVRMGPFRMILVVPIDDELEEKRPPGDGDGDGDGDGENEAAGQD